MNSKSTSRKSLPFFRPAAITLIFCIALSLASCGRKPNTGKGDAADGTGITPPPVELTVFAAASLTETLTELGERYHWEHPNISIILNFGSSGDLARQIQEGAECDVFLSAAPKQMDALDGSLRGDTTKNPNGLNLLMDGSRLDLLENRVVLAVPEGNPGDIHNFANLADRLRAGNVLLAIGNPDVPAGQYSRKIFDYFNINEDAAASCLTYGANVKEVVSQVQEAAADCGIIYATDAFSGNLEVVDEATVEMCGRVIYPGAVLSDSRHRADALEFLDYLSTEEASAVFRWVGFTPLTGSAAE